MVVMETNVFADSVFNGYLGDIVIGARSVAKLMVPRGEHMNFPEGGKTDARIPDAYSHFGLCDQCVPSR